MPSITTDLIRAIAVQGSYGTNPARARRLSSEGYDARQVQDIVNAYIRSRYNAGTLESLVSQANGSAQPQQASEPAYAPEPAPAPVPVPPVVYTEAQTGISISRSDGTFTFDWRNAASYAKQEGQVLITYSSGATSAIAIDWLDSGATQYAYAVDLSSFYPYNGNKITSIGINLRALGNVSDANNQWSSYSKAMFPVTSPSTPILSNSIDSTNYGTITFDWDYVNEKAQTPQLFTDIVCQTALSQSPYQNGVSNWTELGSFADNSNKQIIEDTSIVGSGQSWTRWYRAKSRGPAGDSEWVYSKHTWAYPKKLSANEITNIVSPTDAPQVTLWWSRRNDDYFPIDSVTAQYSFATPITNLDPPVNASFSDGITILDTDNGAAIFDSGKIIPGEDECLYVRVNVKHDNQTVTGEPKLTEIGSLKPPKLTSVAINSTGTTATIGLTNQTAVPGTKMCLVSSVNPSARYIVSDTATSATVDVAEFSKNAGEHGYKFGVFSYLGTDPDKCLIRSEVDWQEGTAAVSPTNVLVKKLDDLGNLEITWDWNWEDANGIDIMWSEREDSWVSNNQPSSYKALKADGNRLVLSGLELGKDYWIAARFTKDNGSVSITGPRSIPTKFSLISVPNKPVLKSSKSIVARGKSIDISWTYTNTDNSEQAVAYIYVDDNKYAEASTQCSAILSQEWAYGSKHSISVAVSSQLGKISEKSDPIYILIANDIRADVVTSLVDLELTNVLNTKYKQRSLTTLPFTITTKGAGVGGVTNVNIFRDGDFHLKRPNETEMDGFDGETIFSKSYSGDLTSEKILVEQAINIGMNGLYGSFDDNARYRLETTVIDMYGQRDTHSIIFYVHWAEQSIKPTIVKVIAYPSNREPYAIINVPSPEGLTDPVLDLYRLSSDKPESIIQNGKFDTDYVDPYTCGGRLGGYRAVVKTKAGDYTTADSKLAISDVYINAKLPDVVINYGLGTIHLATNLSFDNSWEKDFKRTVYLNGSVSGDWNPTVTNDMSISSEVYREDLNLVQQIKELSEYPGICHIRTPDSKSFWADVQVSENKSYDSLSVSYSLSIKKIDAENLDGMTFDDWAKHLEDLVVISEETGN